MCFISTSGVGIMGGGCWDGSWAGMSGIGKSLVTLLRDCPEIENTHARGMG
jgi:hypothetical protein